MHSTDIEKAITDLNKFLRPRHPSSVLQFITGMMVGWTHFDKKKPPSKSEIDLAWNKYFSLLRDSIDRRLSLISSQSNLNVRQTVFRIPLHIYEEKKLNEIIALLGGMSPDDALDFIVEVSTNWCFSIPVNYLFRVPVTFRDKSDEAIANGVYEWLVGYCDLWP